MMLTRQCGMLVANSRAVTTALARRLTPLTDARFFRGRRLDPPRAGMTISALTVLCSTRKEEVVAPNAHRRRGPARRESNRSHNPFHTGGPSKHQHGDEAHERSHRHTML